MLRYWNTTLQEYSILVRVSPQTVAASGGSCSRTRDSMGTGSISTTVCCRRVASGLRAIAAGKLRRRTVSAAAPVASPPAHAQRRRSHNRPVDGCENVVAEREIGRAHV